MRANVLPTLSSPFLIIRTHECANERGRGGFATQRRLDCDRGPRIASQIAVYLREFSTGFYYRGKRPKKLHVKHLFLHWHTAKSKTQLLMESRCFNRNVYINNFLESPNNHVYSWL